MPWHLPGTSWTDGSSAAAGTWWRPCRGLASALLSHWWRSRTYKEFGVDAELLIDHAWGLEPCGIKEIKAYNPSTNSISEGQVLSCPYPYDKARIIVMEMADSLVLQLADKSLVTDSLTLDVGYDRENYDSAKYRGPVHIDHYGRTVPKGAHCSTKLDNPTNLVSILISATTNTLISVYHSIICSYRIFNLNCILRANIFASHPVCFYLKKSSRVP